MNKTQEAINLIVNSMKKGNPSMKILTKHDDLSCLTQEERDFISMMEDDNYVCHRCPKCNTCSHSCECDRIY